MPPSTLADRLPDAVLLGLRRVRRRLWWNEFRGGMVRTVGAAFAGLVILSVVDAFFVSMPFLLRVGLWTVTLLVVASVFVSTLLFPISRRRSFLEIAREVEAGRPEFQERLSTLVSLAGGKADGEAATELVRALKKQAKRDVKRLRPRRDFKEKLSLGAIAVIVGTLVLLGTGFWIFPEGTGRILLRAGNPFSSAGNAFSDGLRVTPGNSVLGEGQPFTISATATAKAPAEGEEFAEILRWDVLGDPSRERMTEVGSADGSFDGEYRIEFPAVSQSFSYRVRMGRMLSALHRVDVIPRPRVDSMRVRYQYPSYTAQNPATAEGEGSLGIRAVEGTRAEVVFSISRPVKDATLYVNETPLWAHSRTGDPRKPDLTWKVDLKPHFSGIWRLDLRDESGVTNEPWEGIIEVVSDGPPRVEVTSPGVGELEVHPDEVFPFTFETVDDFGLASVSAVLTGGNGTVVEVQLSSENSGGKKVRRTTELSLKELASAGEEAAELVVRAADNRGEQWGGSQVTESEPMTLLFSRDADSVPVQTLTAQRERFAGRLWSAIETLVEAEKLAMPLPGQFVSGPPGSGARLQAIGSHCAMAEESVNEVAASMRGTAFSRQSAMLETIAFEDISASRRAVSGAMLKENSRGKAHESRKALRAIEIAISRLQQLLLDFEVEASEATIAAKLESLSMQQAELAKLISDPNNIALLPELQEAQGILATQLGELLSRGAQAKARELVEAVKLGKDLVGGLASLEVRQRELGLLMGRLGDLNEGGPAAIELLSMIAAEQKELGLLASWLVLKQGENYQKLGFVAENGESIDGYLREGNAGDASRAAAANEVIIRELMEGAIDEDHDDLSYLLQRQAKLKKQMSAAAEGDFDAAMLGFQERIVEESRRLERIGKSIVPVSTRWVAVGVKRDLQGALEALQTGMVSAVDASKNLEGSVVSGFSFVANPGLLSHDQRRPPGAPPPPRRFGEDAPADAMLTAKTSPTHAISKTPGNGASIIKTLPPALGEMHFAESEDLPRASEEGVMVDPARAESVIVSGSSDFLGFASWRAVGAAEKWGEARKGFLLAASSLSKIELDESGLYLSDDVREAFEAVMEAELPAEAAIAAGLATEGLEEMASSVGGSSDSGAGWADMSEELSADRPQRRQVVVDAEYRDLVKQYFDAVERESRQE